MKHLFLAILLLGGFIDTFPQALRLESGVTLQESNIYARRFVRNDEKGNPCAVILIRSTEPDLTFSGNVCGEIAYDDATYHVYLPAGTTKLTVANGKRNTLDLKFTPLQSKATYQAVVLETSEKGYLSLTTSPSGAEVYLVTKGERISLGRTPIKNTVLIKAGVYRLEIEKKGYHGWRKKAVTISNGKTTDLGTIKLKAL